VVGIDVRPVDGMLMRSSKMATVYTVDGSTGKGDDEVEVETMLKPGTWATVDFNPVADRLRVIGNDGTNLRANVDERPGSRPDGT